MKPATIPIDYRLWKILAWAGPAFMASFVLLWGVLAGNIPPFGADKTPEQVYAFFIENGLELKIAYSVCLTLTSLYMVWGCAISFLMRRIEGPGNNLLSNLEMMGATITAAPITVSMGIWLTAAHQAPILDPATVHTFYWMGWLIIDLAYMVTSFQIMAISIVCLRDKREKPLVPHYVSWWGVVTIASFFPVNLIPFVTDGPWAFHGSFNFWIAFPTWFIWCPLLSYFVIKGIGRVQAEDEDEAAASQQTASASNGHGATGNGASAATPESPTPAAQA